MTKYRALVVIAFVLLLVGGGLAIWNAERKAPAPEPTSQQDAASAPEVVGQNVSFIVTEGEVKKWKLDAVQAVYSEDRTEAKLRDIKGEFYSADGKPVLQFTAPQGEYVNKNNAVVLTGGVVAKATSEEGGELHAPKMVWNAKTDRVVASGGIEMRFPQGTSTAETCRFTLDFSQLALEGRVTSLITHP
jgi:LPS export ABC transporter protein LptC